jgi:CBS domain-containing protein
MDIKGSEHFIPINRIPLLTPEDTISDAVDGMKRKGTRLVVVANGTERWDLWLDEIAEYCKEKGPVTPWMAQLGRIIEGVPSSEAVGISDPVDLAPMLEKERVVMVMEGANLIGVASRDSQALWPPAVSECIQGHLFFPPIPKRCPFDGTSVE